MSGLHPKVTVVPIDFSELSYAALDRALEIAGDGEVHVIHVLAKLSPMEPGNLYGTVTDATRTKSAVDFMQEQLRETKYRGLQAHAAVGDPGSEIVALAERLKADLIVMPSHGYGLVKRLLLGAVVERVVRLAHCPVLVLRS